MLGSVINWLLGITHGLGYFGIGILMSIESSFFPLPSEVVVPPAAYLASQGVMRLPWIVLAGTLGSLVGAIFNYLLALSLGRLVVYRLAGTKAARFLFISPAKIERAEKYFLSNAKSATFVGRLIPVIRQLVSIPAGFCRMPFGPFILYTAAGAFIWVSILAALGYFIGANQALLITYYREIYWVLGIFGIVWIAWRWRRWRNGKKKNGTVIKEVV